MYTNLFIPGFPKCGTSYILRHFANHQPLWKTIDGTHELQPSHLQELVQMKMPIDYYAMKQPGVIRASEHNRRYYANVLKHHCIGRILCVICVRDFNEIMYSLYQHQKRSKIELPEYSVFKDEIKKEYFENLILKLQNFKRLFGSLKIISLSTIEKYPIHEIFKFLELSNIMVPENSEPFKRTEYSMDEYVHDKELETLYANFLKDFFVEEHMI